LEFKCPIVNLSQQLREMSSKEEKYFQGLVGCLSSQNQSIFANNLQEAEKLEEE